MCATDQWDRRLQQVLVEYGVENWDGYSALPVNVSSLLYAHKFLRMVDPSGPAPEVSVDPDGEVSLSWYGDSGSVFSISVSEAGRLACAYLSPASQFSEFSWVWYLTDRGLSFNE